MVAEEKLFQVFREHTDMSVLGQIKSVNKTSVEQIKN